MTEGASPMTIHFNLDFEDLLAFQQDVIKHAHTHYIKEKYSKWITTIILFITLFFLMKASFVTGVLSLIIAIFYFITFPFLYSKVTFAKLKKQMQKNDYSYVLGACSMTFSDTGIDRELNDEITHFDWNQFEKWHEDCDRYFLYVSDLQGLIIPKEPGGMIGEEKAAHHDLIRQHLGD